MAEGKGIEIKIAAIGGDQAAAEIRKVEGAVKDLPAGSSEAGAGVADLSEKLAEMKQRAEGLREASADLGEETQKNTQRNNLAKAASIGLAAGGAVVAKTFGEIAKGLASIDLAKLATMDAEMAAQIETAKGWSEILTDPLNGIQRLISGATISEAFADLNDQLSRNAEMQAEAVNRMTMAGRKTAEELKDIARDIAAANEIIEAKQASDAKARDVTDAARERAGEAPEDIRVERAAYDRDQRKDAVDRGLGPVRAKTQALFEDAEIAKANAATVAADSRATKPAIDDANAKAKAAEKLFLDAKKEYNTAAAVASEKRRGIVSEYTGEVADAEADKAERLKKQAEAAKAKAEAKKLKDYQLAARARKGDGADGITTASLGMDAAKEAREMGNERGADQLERKARELMKNPSQDGSKRLMEMMESMLNWAENQTSDDKGASRIDALEKKLLILEARQKNSRNGK